MQQIHRSALKIDQGRSKGGTGITLPLPQAGPGRMFMDRHAESVPRNLPLIRGSSVQLGGGAPWHSARAKAIRTNKETPSWPVCWNVRKQENLLL